MFVWRQWARNKRDILTGEVINLKVYKMLLLFGFIPLYIFIDGK